MIDNPRNARPERRRVPRQRRLFSGSRQHTDEPRPPGEILPPQAIICNAAPSSIHGLFILAAQTFHETIPVPADQIVTMLGDREALMSTALGLGVSMPHASIPRAAIPHAAIPGLAYPTARLFLLKNPLVWSAFDRIPVDIVVCTLFADDDRRSYLSWVSAVAGALRNDERRDRLRHATDAEEAWAILFTGTA